MSKELLQQLSRDLMAIRESQDKASEERSKQSTTLTEIRTVLLGTQEQPEMGLVSQVATNRKDINKIYRYAAYLLGGSGLTAGGAWNWDTLTKIFSSSHG